MSGNHILATRKFTSDDQLEFANLSGDWNPMHMDPVAARRTAAGAPVVHGIHLLLWSLDALAAEFADGRSVASLKVRFARWVYLDQDVEILISKIGEQGLAFSLCVKGVKIMTAQVGLDGRPVRPADWAPPTPETTKQAADLDLDQMRRQSGVVALSASAHRIEQMFPAAVQFVGLLEVAGLINATKLVGMECPGLHSIFDGINVDFNADAPRSTDMDYAVTDVDERFRSVKMKLSGAGLIGTVSAFARVPPVAQSTLIAIAQLVKSREFSGGHALIVGGSRGLGEFCAKAIAAGGGRVTITYAAGKAEAERVQSEIVVWGGVCDILHFDALMPAAPQLSGVKGAPTSIYYFATGTIFSQKSREIDFSAFAYFSRYYSEGFYNLCKAHHAVFGSPATLFYPSSVSLEDRPLGMAEYSMAKAAGEVICDEIPKLMPGLTVVRHRLPRLPTDQTSTMVPVKTMTVEDVMLPLIRKVQGSTRQDGLNSDADENG